MSGEWIAGLLTAVGLLAGAIGASATKFFDARTKRVLAEQAATLADYQALYARQEKQIERQDAQIAEQQVVIARYHAMHVECREQAVELYGFCRLLHVVACANHAALLALGAKVEPVPDMPPLRPTHADESEFLARSTAQATVSTREISEGLPHADPAR